MTAATLARLAWPGVPLALLADAVLIPAAWLGNAPAMVIGLAMMMGASVMVVVGTFFDLRRRMQR